VKEELERDRKIGQREGGGRRKVPSAAYACLGNVNGGEQVAFFIIFGIFKGREGGNLRSEEIRPAHSIKTDRLVCAWIGICANRKERAPH